MFDQKPGLGLNTDNNNQGNEPSTPTNSPTPSMPTPPPVRGSEINVMGNQGAEVEDIFSPVSSGEETIKTNNINPSVSNENRNIGAGLNPIKTKSSGKKVVLVILIIALIAIIAGGAWYYVTYYMTTAESTGNVNVPAGDTLNNSEEEVANVNTNINTNINVEEENIIVPTEDINKPVTDLTENIDTDSDGLLDAQELAMGADPFNPDSDVDGLFDGEEVNIYGTNPTNPDSDGDGYGDGDEIKGGYNPNGPGMLPGVRGL